MKRKFYFFLAALCCMLFISAPGIKAQEDKGYLRGTVVYWTYDKGTLTIGTEDAEKKSVMPDFYYDEEFFEPVIPWWKYSDDITTIIVESGITGLCADAFTGTAVEKVQLPDGLKTINGNAFYYCEKLKAIKIPSSVTSIEADVFHGCKSLTEVNIPDGITALYASTFERCTSLPAITLPSSLKEINDAVFYDCDALVSVTCLAATPPEIDWLVYPPFNGTDMELTVPKGSKDAYEMSDWKKYFKTIKEDGGIIVEPDEEKTIEGVLYQRFGEEWTVSKVTDDAPVNLSFKTSIGGKIVKKIAKEAMKGNTKVETLDIPSSITDIHQTAFGNSKIKSVNWNVKKLSGELTGTLFENCYKLYSVTFGDEVEEIPDYFCNEVASLEDVTFSKAVKLKTIGKSAFYMTGITSIDLSTTDEVSIGTSAFADCTELKSALLEGEGDKKGVTAIGMEAFSGCTSLTEVNIPEGVTIIRPSVFYGCVLLTKITLPESTERIGDATFYDCTSLVSVTCRAVTPPEIDWSEGIYPPFNGKDMELIIPRGSKEDYEKSDWKDYFKTIKEGDFGAPLPDEEKTVEGVLYQRFGEEWTVSKVTNDAPSHLTLLDEIEDRKVTKIGKKALNGNTKVEHFNIPSSVTDIDLEAFGECKIKYLGWNVKKLSGELTLSPFYNCDKLYSITFGDEVEEIPDKFCSNITSLEDVTFSQAVKLKKIGMYAFYETGITSVDMRVTDGVSIGAYAFAYCAEMQTALLEGNGDKKGVTSIGDNAFTECSSLWMVDLSTETGYIGEEAFYKCDISSIVLDGVEEIDSYAFADQTSPMSITIKNKLPELYTPATFDGTTISKMRVDCSLETAYKASVNWMYIVSSPEFSLMADNLEDNMIAILPDYALEDKCSFIITKTPTCADPTYEIEPLPAEGYVFIGWEGQECSVSKLTINAKDIKSGNIAATAKFQKTDNFTVKITAKTSPEGIGGTKAYVCKDTPRPQNAYEKGEIAVFKAQDAKGWATFRGWDHNVDRFNPYVVINKETISFEVVTEGEDATPTEVTAVYKYNDIDVNIQVKTTGTGEVKTSADKAKLGGKVTLTATPGKTQKFLQWKDMYGNVVSTNAETEVSLAHTILYALYKDGETKAELNSAGELRPYSDFETDYTLVAEYTAVFEDMETHKVTLVAENGKISVTEPDIDLEHVISGTVLHLTATPNEGYVFDSWTNYDTEKGLTVTSDTTVTAAFKLKTYTVEFVDWDDKELKSETVEHGKAATAPTDPTREGYHFTDWDKKFDKVTEDLTVKAQYEINKYTVTFYDKDDKVLSTQTVNWNEAAKAPETPVWEGHTFTGWSAEFDHVKSDLDIKPIYDAETYSVTFLGFGDVELKKENVEYGKAATAPSAPEVTGYTFKNWDKDFTNITGDLTVKAVYEINKYKVVFVDWDDKELKSEEVEYGKAATAPTDPEREGYTFTGWDKKFDNITADLTVKAQYEEVIVIDYTPKNLKAVLTPQENDDVLITLSWDKVEGAISYDLRVSIGEKELFTRNTMTLNVIATKLSDIEKEYKLTPGTFTIDWAVRSTDMFAKPISDWAKGESFEVTVKDPATGIDKVQGDKVQGTKVLINGVLYIERNGVIYDVTGKMVK